MQLNREIMNLCCSDDLFAKVIPIERLRVAMATAVKFI